MLQSSAGGWYYSGSESFLRFCADGATCWPTSRRIVRECTEPGRARWAQRSRGKLVGGSFLPSVGEHDETRRYLGKSSVHDYPSTDHSWSHTRLHLTFFHESLRFGYLERVFRAKFTSLVLRVFRKSRAFSQTRQLGTAWLLFHSTVVGGLASGCGTWCRQPPSTYRLFPLSHTRQAVGPSALGAWKAAARGVSSHRQTFRVVYQRG